ncbi:hypothetical protein MKX03_011051, partial [Papaver bracteatum]
MTTGDEITKLAINGKSLKPCLDMYFSSIKEAEDYYKDYGRSLGFCTRRRSSYATARGPLITGVVFVCSCEGIHQSKPNRPDQGDRVLKRKRNTSTMMTDCKAMVSIDLNKELNTWYINKFIENHNHEMISPGKRHLMRVNKVMPPAARCLAETFNKQKLQVGKVASLFGESGNIGSTARDVYNHLIN